MARDISTFVSNFDGGARANLYKVTITAPVANFQDIDLVAKSINLPASTLGEMPVPFYGRVLKLAGDRTYEDWTMTVINHEDLRYRKAFEEWNLSINQHRENIPAGDYKTLVTTGTVLVQPLDRIGKPTRTYTLYHAFPREISTIDMAFDQNDTISEFSVTWGYTYFELS